MLLQPVNSMNRLVHRASWAILLAGALAPALAQYQNKQWANFEDGKLPANVVTIGANPQQSLSVVELKSVSGQPPAFRSEQAVKETGTFGLAIKSSPGGVQGAYSNGVLLKDVLDRDQLGPNGRALFQGDFFVPDEAGVLPSLAILAIDVPTTYTGLSGGNIGALNTGFYRFGFTKQAQLYFSTVVPRSANAAFFENDPSLLKQIPRPGWHRFAIVCEGKDTIRCYVDGRETAFSPIQEPQLRKLAVGVLLADNEKDYTAYVDNISIQVSEDAPVLPESPYINNWTVEASKSATGGGLTSKLPSLRAQQNTQWMEPIPAWQQAQAQRKPLLLYFYAPGLSATERLENFFASDTAAKSFLGKHVAARIDVNQLQGTEIARQYNIFKVPTLMVISPDAKSHKRVTPSSRDEWNSIQQQITLP